MGWEAGGSGFVDTGLYPTIIKLQEHVKRNTLNCSITALRRRASGLIGNRSRCYNHNLRVGPYNLAGTAGISDGHMLVVQEHGANYLDGLTGPKSL